MNKTLLAIVIAVVILVVVALIYYFLIYLPSKTQVTSQAFTVTSVPSTSLTATVVSSPQILGVPFYVSSGSALAQYAYQQLKVVQGPIFVGDSAWLILQTPTGNYVAEVIDTVAAEQMGVGTVIVPGTTITPIVV